VPLSDADDGLFALFFHGFRVTFVASNDVHLIAFDLSFQNERVGSIGNALAKALGHLERSSLRQPQLRSDLMGTIDTVWPSQITHHRVTLLVIDQSINRKGHP